jgi:integrase
MNPQVIETTAQVPAIRDSAIVVHARRLEGEIVERVKHEVGRPKGVRKRRGIGMIYLRGDTFWIQYFVHGRRIRESSGSTSQTVAEDLLDKRKGSVANGTPVGPDVEKTTFEDLARILTTDYKIRRRRSIARIEDALNHLRGFFGDRKAYAITADRVEVYVASRQDEKAADATINRELCALKRAFHLAAKHKRVAVRPEIDLLTENNAREGFIEQAAFLALREALPDDLKDPVTFLWLTAWRVGEMRSLCWQNVYADAIRLSAKNSKNKKGRELPLMGELAEVIARARALRRPECVAVFQRDGKPIGSFRKSWATACTKAEVGELLVHDLRRSAIRNLIRAGVNQHIAMEISGHRTDNIFRRYDIPTTNDLAKAVQAQQAYLALQPTDRNVVPISAAPKKVSHKTATATG